MLVQLIQHDFIRESGAAEALIADPTFKGIEKTDQFGWTPLMEASSRGYLRIVQMLIKRGVSLNTFSLSGNTALHFASDHGHIHCIHALLKAGANLESKNYENRFTPLGTAISASEAESIEILLDYGAKLPIGHPELDHCWPHSILNKRKSLKQTSLVFLVLAKRTGSLSKDTRSIVSFMLWTTRNNNVWIYL